MVGTYLIIPYVNPTYDTGSFGQCHLDNFVSCFNFVKNDFSPNSTYFTLITDNSDTFSFTAG